MMVVFRAESVFKTLFFYLAYILKTKKQKKRRTRRRWGDKGDFCVLRAIFSVIFSIT